MGVIIRLYRGHIGVVIRLSRGYLGVIIGLWRVKNFGPFGSAHTPNPVDVSLRLFCC